MLLWRAIPVGSIVVLLPGCAVGARVGPRVGVTDGDSTLQAEGTFALGMNTAAQDSVCVPLALALGDTSDEDGRKGAAQLETGIEVGLPFEESLFGLRAGGRAGAWLDGRGGYVGVRAGPTVALVERRGVDYGDAQIVPTLSLEGFANIGAGGDFAGAPQVGGVLTLGAELFTSIDLRMRSGRPLATAEGAHVVATTRRGDGWTRPRIAAVTHLPPHERTVLGEAWLEDAVVEHASIAAFARLALELLALGAPAILVERAHRAALDEARHARTCFAIAAAYLERIEEPGPLPLHTAATGPGSFAALALTSLVDGAWGEGLAASVARARARTARDPAVRRALRAIALDEARHAELAWDVMAWCLGCDPAVRATLATGFEALAAGVPASLAGQPRTPSDDVAASDSGVAIASVVHRARLRVIRRVGSRLAAMANRPGRGALLPQRASESARYRPS